jgi:hypothetical protein
VDFFINAVLESRSNPKCIYPYAIMGITFGNPEDGNSPNNVSFIHLAHLRTDKHCCCCCCCSSNILLWVVVSKKNKKKKWENKERRIKK